MKKTFLVLVVLLTGKVLFAQPADDLQKTARMQTQRSQFDSAYRTLEMALKQKPNDADLLKDQAYVCYLKRDYENGLRIGQQLTQGAAADEQSYQLLGMVYKGLAEYKEAAKMYETAIKKFPASGVLYSEYGDLLMLDKNPNDAINTWEKGIKQDVNNNSNYYYAAKYYLENKNLLWGLLYGEIFVNIESYTQRTQEMKELLYNGYKQLFSGAALTKVNSSSKEGVSKTITELLVKDAMPLAGDTIMALSDIRTKFIVDWVNSGSAKKYPFRLFDLHRQLIEGKAFTAYNQWLFGEAANAGRYEQWKAANAAQAGQWEQLLHNVVFKIPAGQYYAN